MSEFIMTHDNAKEVFKSLRRAIWGALQGGAVSIVLRQPNKTRDQEKHYHALIREISRQVRTYGKQYNVEVWKALLVDRFERECEEMGEPLTHRGQLIPSLDMQRMVTVRPSTKRFTRKEGAAFIDFLYAFGVECGVTWSATAQQIATAQQHGQLIEVAQ